MSDVPESGAPQPWLGRPTADNTPSAGRVRQGRTARLSAVLSDLLIDAPEIEAAAVVSFDGLPMASALPRTMDEDRVAAMSAALLSLGERAAEGLGRGELSQVYIEGEHGTVFLVSADNEAVLVAVAAKGAKVGMMLFEVRRTAVDIAAVLRDSPQDEPAPTSQPVTAVSEVPESAPYPPAAAASYQPNGAGAKAETSWS